MAGRSHNQPFRLNLEENAMSDPTRPYEPLTSAGELKHKARNLPIIVTTARDSMWGPTFPELMERDSRGAT
jgi:hypothetical protein